MTVRNFPIHVWAVLSMAASPVLAAEPAAKTLRQEFMECDRQASTSFLGFGDATRCSRIYEQLLRSEFQGDFARLLAWWQAERLNLAATASDAPPRR
jgi:hypothetical protein